MICCTFVPHIFSDSRDDIDSAKREVAKRQRHARKLKVEKAQPYCEFTHIHAKCLFQGFLTFDSVYAAYKAYAVLSQGHSTLRGHVYKAPSAKVGVNREATDPQDLVSL